MERDGATLAHIGDTSRRLSAMPMEIMTDIRFHDISRQQIE
jgi:hypothetical protein